MDAIEEVGGSAVSGINVASSRLLLAEHGNRWYIERNGRKLCTISMEPLMIIANQNSMGSSETVLDMFLFGWNFHDGYTNINFSNSIHDQNCMNEETKEEERMNVVVVFSENIFFVVSFGLWWCLKYFFAVLPVDTQPARALRALSKILYRTRDRGLLSSMGTPGLIIY